MHRAFYFGWAPSNVGGHSGDSDGSCKQRLPTLFKNNECFSHIFLILPLIKHQLFNFGAFYLLNLRTVTAHIVPFLVPKKIVLFSTRCVSLCDFHVSREAAGLLKSNVIEAANGRRIKASQARLPRARNLEHSSFVRNVGWLWIWRVSSGERTPGFP